ncbi:MAG TPA: diacylglycerol kinase family protein [Thermoanaerobaculia bacterium]
MPIRGALFMNPSSGTADVERAEAIRAEATAAGLDVVTLARGLDLHAEIRGRIDRGQRLFVAAGGDGTVHSVTQPLVGTDGELAVLPVGTWNHFARDVGMPLDWREALRAILTGKVLQVDAGRVNDRFFVNNLSLGFYPELVQHREKYRQFGKWRAYLHAMSAAMKKFPHVALAVEAPNMFEAIRTHMFMVSVNAYDLDRPGFIAPRETLDGGFLSVYWLPELPKHRFVVSVGRYLRGKVTADGAVRTVRTTRLRVQSARPSMRVGLDGEIHDLTTPIVISIVRRGLNVRVPRNTTA